mmetsp:Transcript_13985/g.32863  ORF Transcript_13985/g.32863 Transcript_13985/m.32863 type:complete len:491 (-) Transcript_13985:115-1587(-)
MANVLTAAIGQFKDTVATRRNSDDLASHAFQTVFQQLDAEFMEDVRRKKAHPAASPQFNVFISGLVLLNAVVTGVEVDQYRGDRLEDRTFFAATDGIFLVFFVAEVLLRLHHVGWEYLADPWNVFDYMLVVLNLSDIVTSVNNQGAAGLKLASTLRVLRLLRVVRVIRGLRRFHAAWIVSQTLLDTVRTIVWIGLLFLVVSYTLAVVLTTMVTDGDESEEQWGQAGRYFGTPWRSLWTLIQVITLDRWMVEIARPLSRVSPLAVVLLVLVIVVCTFGIANLIIAMMVEHLNSIVEVTSNRSNTVLEMTELNVVKAIGEEFQMAVHDGSGELGLAAFKAMLRSPNVVLQLQLLGIMCDEAEGLFHIMDADKSGSVSPEEFVYGLTKLKGPAKGQDLVALIVCCQHQCQKASRFVERIKQLNAKADKIQVRLDDVGRSMSTELVGRLDAKERHKDVLKKAAKRQQFLDSMDLNREFGWPTLKEDKVKYGILY